MFTLLRSLIALDVETDGIGTPEETRIVELGFKQLYPDGCEPKTWVGTVNPGRPIDTNAVKVHGIKDEDVINRPMFKDLAPNLALGFRDCDYCGYNVRFDLRVLQAEMNRASVEWTYEGAFILDSLRMQQIAEPRTLSDAVRKWLKREPKEAHRALGDAEDALDVALELYELFPIFAGKTLAEVHGVLWPINPEWIDTSGKIVWKRGEACLGFGKHSGTALRLVPRPYLEWILSSNFESSTKQVILLALQGNYPVK